MEALTCPACWAKGFVAVLYLDASQPVPQRVWCPTCGTQRDRQVISRA